LAAQSFSIFRQSTAAGGDWRPGPKRCRDSDHCHERGDGRRDQPFSAFGDYGSLIVGLKDCT